MKEIKGFVAEYFGYDIVRDSWNSYHIEKDGDPQAFMRRATPDLAYHDCITWIDRNMELKIENFKKKKAEKINNGIGHSHTKNILRGKHEDFKL